MAMISLLPPAFGRVVAYLTRQHVWVTVLMLMCATVLFCVFIDALRNRRVSPALGWSGVLVILVNVLTYFTQISD